MNQEPHRDSPAMAGISKLLYQTALEFVEGIASGQLHQPIKYPSAVIILTTAAAEAYINEVLEFQLFSGQDPTRQAAIKEVREQDDLRDKWVRAPEILGGTRLCKAAEPYRSFDQLIKLRNAIVHYDAGFRTPLEYPNKLAIGEYRRRFKLTHEGQTDWTAQILNLECARWACETTQRMVQAFHLHSRIHQHLAWMGPA